MCGSPRRSSLIIAVVAIICSILSEFFGYMLILRDGPKWNVIIGMVCWGVICAAAIALYYGAHEEKRFMVLIWLIVAFLLGSTMIIVSFISAGQQLEARDTIEDTLVAIIKIVMLGFFICMPLKFYRTMT